MSLTPRRTKRRAVADSDEEGAHEFPPALLADAQATEWDSPTKPRRVLSGPVKRAKRQAQEQEGLHGVSLVEERDTVAVNSDMDIIVEGNNEISIDVTGANRNPAFTIARSESLEITQSELDLFVDCFDTHVAGFYHLEHNLFVVQGWDSKRQQATDNWYHLEYRQLDNEISLACSCRSGTSSLASTCIHQEFFRRYEVEGVLQTEDFNSGPTDSEPAILFMKQLLPGNVFRSMFSVRSTSSSALMGRAIVMHKGLSHVEGTWSCSKDSQDVCSHIRLAHATLVAIHNGEGLLEDRPPEPLLVTSKTGAVSHLPVHLPSWALLPLDPQLYPLSAPFQSLPEHPFLLNESSSGSCPCPTGRTYYNPVLPTTIRKCKVYTLTHLYRHSIMLQACPSCPSSRRRFIGPDLRTHGVFNYNNSILVSHELLNEYTSEFTSSETPFTAFVVNVARRYSLVEETFMGEDLFRSVWFAFVSLQAFNDDMKCFQCGPFPETVIWDGISAGFGRKHVRESLEPPTTTSDASLLRDRVKYCPKQQAIVDSALRKHLRGSLAGPSLNGLLDDEENEDREDTTSSTRPSAVSVEHQARQRCLVEDHICQIEAVEKDLHNLCPALADLFRLYLGPEAYAKRRKIPQVYKSLFSQIAAEESILQLINLDSLIALRSFLDNPILSIPILFKTVEAHADLNEIIPIFLWLDKRVLDVLTTLMVEPPFPEDGLEVLPDVDDASDWKDTGCFYSMPKIRNRPQYPKLRYDQQREKSGSKRGDRCGKYFERYGEKGLTGGIMAAWCTHSVCYGFHCIAESEGRDDVFSAMVTRWPTAPKRVIYDFACALGPYSILREPHFFAKTYFLIDHFHSQGHTKCSHAAFLSQYANVDPCLVHINSSAAECGNGGMRKIRKSVSYMSQKRAIIYTKIFLSVWNRLRLRRMSGSK
ncbi:hypothetical protein BKA70DRAFT_1377642 [Coprinopsis sp. MPI-PUGE-AT-0042]|nr:hypothetical protein BKA70DRAFT_1377642 [Coprinopsis sp. MPI-PUGE-AT-0042]